jgi:hypothetical protein
MADINTSQQFNVQLAITNAAGDPAQVDGVPMWASSDETVVMVVAAADGMSATVPAVAPNAVGGDGNPLPVRISVSADADLGSGVVAITGVSEDIFVTLDPAQQASVITLTLGPPVAKT